MSNDPFSDFADRNAGEQHDIFKFKAIGDTVVGTLTEKVRVKDIKSKFTGEMEETAIINVRTDAGEEWSLFVKRGGLLNAIAAAVREHGAGTKLEEGGRLAVRFTSEVDTGKGNPAKVYEATYKPPAQPVAASAGGSDLGDLV